MRTLKFKGGKYQDDFVKACRTGNVEKVNELIKKKVVNPAANNQLSLSEAITNQHPEVVKILLADPRINPALNNQYSFILACQSNTNESIVRLLLADPRINPSLEYQRGFLLAIMHNKRIPVVRLFLSDPRINPALNSQHSFNIACGYGEPEIVTLFLEDPRINPSLDNQHALQKAIEKGNIKNVKVLLRDPRINPSNNDQEALRKACLVGQTEIVKFLLTDPRVDPSVNEQEPLRIATENGHAAVVAVLKADPRVRELVVKKWKGFTRSDILKFDSVFEETANNYSCCPVCLRYVSREDGCMYMNHNCNTEPGPKTIHKKLYDMYKNPEGKIYWCTICGRICMGHRHYKLGPIDTKADLVPAHPGANPFATDCRLTEGGGGLNEKAQRFHAFRQYALMLQEEVGEILHNVAIDQLVESMWVAPLVPATRKLAEKNVQAKKYAIAHNEFPVTPVEEVANIPRPAQNAALLPVILESGYNAISMLDDEKVIQFHHRQRNGQINKHTGEGEQIGVDSFVNYIRSNLSDGVAGKCWLASCTADIHPDEIQELVRFEVFPEDLQKQYKDAFNRTHQAGGANPNILREAKHAECVIFSAKRQTRKKRQ